jgi:hypothetical protein
MDEASGLGAEKGSGGGGKVNKGWFVVGKV